ncbi:hypothetical protein Hdeb2414_s0006g00206361 [Helianthus debilis subsp. tardiflorus]
MFSLPANSKNLEEANKKFYSLQEEYSGVNFQDTEDIDVSCVYENIPGSRFARVDVFSMEGSRFNLKTNLVPKAVRSKTGAPKFLNPNKSKGNGSMHGFTLEKCIVLHINDWF